jgi:hypothetical protein
VGIVEEKEMKSKEAEWETQFAAFKTSTWVTLVWKYRAASLQKKKLMEKGVSIATLNLVEWGKTQWRRMEQGKLTPSQEERFRALMDTTATANPPSVRPPFPYIQPSNYDPYQKTRKQIPAQKLRKEKEILRKNLLAIQSQVQK